MTATSAGPESHKAVLFTLPAPRQPLVRDGEPRAPKGDAGTGLYTAYRQRLGAEQEGANRPAAHPREAQAQEETEPDQERGLNQQEAAELRAPREARMPNSRHRSTAIDSASTYAPSPRMGLRPSVPPR